MATLVASPPEDPDRQAARTHPAPTFPTPSARAQISASAPPSSLGRKRRPGRPLRRDGCRTGACRRRTPRDTEPDIASEHPNRRHCRRCVLFCRFEQLLNDCDGRHSTGDRVVDAQDDPYSSFTSDRSPGKIGKGRGKPLDADAQRVVTPQHGAEQTPRLPPH